MTRTPGRRRSSPRRRSEGGIALIVVLFLAAILTLMMYAFLREMQVEYALASGLGAEKQADQLAWSAIDRAIAAVQAGEPSAEWYEVELAAPDGAPVGVYSLLAPTDEGPGFGIAEEAARVNVNVAPRDMILKLPRVTAEIADAILDWRDPDDAVTGAGAESAYYLALQPGYPCKNGALDTVEELRLVKGVTGEVLYGEDANLNGILDPNENDGDATPPYDDADGVLEPGLMAYVTVWSYDRNVQASGAARVNINTAGVPQLTEALGDALTPGQIANIVTRRPLVAAAVNAPGYRSGADLMDVAGVGVPGLDAERYRAIADRVTAIGGETIPGLIGVNVASRRILEAIPGWTPEDAAAVVEYRSKEGSDLSNIGWLTRVLPAAKVQAATPFLTVRSQQFRMDAVGRVGPRSELAATELVSPATGASEPPIVPMRAMKRYLAVFDRAADRPRLVYWKDISVLGMAYPFEEPGE